MSILGMDWSHWQGKVTTAILKSLWDAGYRFIYIKVSQGTGYKDDCFEYNSKAFQEYGFLVGGYHFVTLANAIQQYNWFMKCMGSFKFDLPPCLDCEAYTSSSLSEIHISNKIYRAGTEPEVVPVRPPYILETDFAKLHTESYDIVFSYKLDKAVRKLGGMMLGTKYTAEKLSYVLPTESVVDVIASRLCGYQDFPVPCIYTNAGFGNVIFKSPAMAKYLLFVANWNVAKPLLPTVWKNEQYFIWQDKVISGKPYGMSGDMDHDIWGPLPFPENGESPTEQTPDKLVLDINFKVSANIGSDRYEGSINIDSLQMNKINQ